MRRLRQLGRLLRNVWILRREILERLGLRQRKPVRTAQLRCLHCRRPLTKPCRPRHRAHVVEVPAGYGTPDYPDGSLMYVRQTKPGKPAVDVRGTPF